MVNPLSSTPGEAKLAQDISEAHLEIPGQPKQIQVTRSFTDEEGKTYNATFIFKKGTSREEIETQIEAKMPHIKVCTKLFKVGQKSDTGKITQKLTLLADGSAERTFTKEINGELKRIVKIYQKIEVDERIAKVNALAGKTLSPIPSDTKREGLGASSAARNPSLPPSIQQRALTEGASASPTPTPASTPSGLSARLAPPASSTPASTPASSISSSVSTTSTTAPVSLSSTPSPASSSAALPPGPSSSSSTSASSAATPLSVVPPAATPPAASAASTPAASSPAGSLVTPSPTPLPALPAAMSALRESKEQKAEVKGTASSPSAVTPPSSLPTSSILDEQGMTELDRALLSAAPLSRTAPPWNYPLQGVYGLGADTTFDRLLHSKHLAGIMNIAALKPSTFNRGEFLNIYGEEAAGGVKKLGADAMLKAKYPPHCLLNMRGERLATDSRNTPIDQMPFLIMEQIDIAPSEASQSKAEKDMPAKIQDCIARYMVLHKGKLPGKLVIPFSPGDHTMMLVIEPDKRPGKEGEVHVSIVDSMGGSKKYNKMNILKAACDALRTVKPKKGQPPFISGKVTSHYNKVDQNNDNSCGFHVQENLKIALDPRVNVYEECERGAVPTESEPATIFQERDSRQLWAICEREQNIIKRQFMQIYHNSHPDAQPHLKKLYSYMINYYTPRR